MWMGKRPCERMLDLMPYKCPYFPCPCIFETESDLKKHLKTFGDDVKTHYVKWKRSHRDIERGNSLMKV